MEVAIREIAFGSEDYKKTILLRDEILRRPLGLKFTNEELASEAADTHFAAFLDGNVCGSLILTARAEAATVTKFLKAPYIKMRQVAVATSSQKMGIGRKLVEFSENYAEKHGFGEIRLSARATAVDFYLARGYEIYGEPLVEVGLPHRKMRKQLPPSQK